MDSGRMRGHWHTINVASEVNSALLSGVPLGRVLGRHVVCLARVYHLTVALAGAQSGVCLGETIALPFVENGKAVPAVVENLWIFRRFYISRPFFCLQVLVVQLSCRYWVLHFVDLWDDNCSGDARL